MRPVLCPVLVGRDGEMRHLRGALDAASTGRGKTALLVGEAGIGKSRLARELSAAARQRGIVVLTGRAVAGQVPVPFRPFTELPGGHCPFLSRPAALAGALGA